MKVWECKVGVVALFFGDDGEARLCGDDEAVTCCPTGTVRAGNNV